MTSDHGKNSRASRTPTPPKSERELLRRLAAELPPLAGAVQFGDDLAPLEPRPGGLLWTTDMLMDGVDFDSTLHGWPEIGYKAMVVNLSDCAASATIPVAALCAVALSDNLTMDDALALFRGVRTCGDEFACPITGGDTNSWAHPTVISITIAAQADADLAPVGRNGAEPGDRVYLSGKVGGSLLGRHMRPRPRIELARRVNRELQPHAMIDISDGLAIDLSRICEASGCGAVLDDSALDDAIHPDAVRRSQKTGIPAREHALYDGEDFELIIVVAGEVPDSDCRRLGLLPLGLATETPALATRARDGSLTPLEARGWEHFRD